MKEKRTGFGQVHAHGTVCAGADRSGNGRGDESPSLPVPGRNGEKAGSVSGGIFPGSASQEAY